MNNQIIKFFNNPKKYLGNINFLKKNINLLIEENEILQSKLSNGRLTIFNKLVDYIIFKKEKKSDLTEEVFKSTQNNYLKYELSRINLKFYELLLRYILLLFLLNYINKNEYNYYKSQINTNEPPIKESLIIKEESPNNFGHNNVVIQGNVTFPEAKSDKGSYYNSYGSNSGSSGSAYNGSSGSAYNGSSGSAYNGEPTNFDVATYFNKQEYLKTVAITPASNDYFKLYRYSFEKNQPNNRDGPTLSLSLFMPNSNIYKKNYESFGEKYFSNQIRIILIFKYFFPDCNIRVYFDWYTLEKGFATLSGDDESLILTKKITEFTYNDFEETVQIKIRQYLSSFYDKIKKYETTPFKNGLERFLTYYHLASKVRNDNLEAIIDDVPGDFFVYKFTGPFIENQGADNEGHITNGYIGQQVRYISLRQTNYEWENLTIKRPKHLVWRDAHANCSSYNDYLWIKQMNDYSKNGNKELYLIPTSIIYAQHWHDIVKCNVDGRLYFRSAIAGIVQFVNSTDSNQFINNDIYNRSIGVTFLLDANNKLAVLKHRHKGYTDNQTEYGYGIDEYINSAFFNMNEIKKYSIYFQHYFGHDILRSNNYFWRIELLLLKYLIREKIITGDNISQIEFLKKVEELRNDKSLANNNELRLLLSIYPNKYHFSTSIFSAVYGKPEIDFYNKKVFIIKDLIKTIDSNMLEYFDNLSLDNLEKLGLTCKSSALASSMEWCVRPYLYAQESLDNCPPANYYSGFYFDKPPSLDIGILRQPSDLPYAIESLEKNKLLIPLNKSDYKITVEKDNFKNDIFKNIDDNKCHIKPALQNIILNFGIIDPEFGVSQCRKIATKVSYLNPNGISVTQSNVWNPLIWKALNYYGYDVKPDCLKVKLNDNASYEQFNELVIELAKISGWAEYAANILLKDDDTYDSNANDFDSPVVKAKTERYTGMDSENHERYKMSSYKNKYLKYKQKYMVLKNKI